MLETSKEMVNLYFLCHMEVLKFSYVIIKFYDINIFVNLAFLVFFIIFY